MPAHGLIGPVCASLPIAGRAAADPGKSISCSTGICRERAIILCPDPVPLAYSCRGVGVLSTYGETDLGQPRQSSTGTVCLRILLTASLLALAGCASTDRIDYGLERDPFQRINLASHRFNTKLDRFVIRPSARVYDRVLPDKLQRRATLFFRNLRGPIDITNNLLQGKFRYGFSGIGRLLVNSTIGLGGIFDPAARMGLPRHAEDFGQTLAVWGVPAGPYLVLPLVGPTNTRDLAGTALGWQIHPTVQHDDNRTRNALIVLEIVDTRAGLLVRDRSLDAAVDDYVHRRQVYELERNHEIHDGNPPVDDAGFDLPVVPLPTQPSVPTAED